MFGSGLDIDEIVVYNRALSASEVAQLAGNGGSPLPGASGPAFSVEPHQQQIDLSAAAGAHSSLDRLGRLRAHMAASIAELTH